jgi:hypothetical protein
MTPANFDLPDLYRGDSYGPLTFKFKDSEGNLIDFTGARVDIQVKNKKCVTALSWSTENSSVYVDSEMIILNMADPSKTNIPPDTYNYDFQISQNGIVRTYLRGKLNVIKDITQIQNGS